MYFQVIDFNAKDTTTCDNFQIIPPNLELYDKTDVSSDDDYGIMKCVSKFFKDRRTNLIYIKDMTPEYDKSYDNHYMYYSTLIDTFKDIIDIYASQSGALIITNILKVEKKDIVNASRFVGFVTMEGLLNRSDSDEIMLYCNDIVGNKFYELGNSIWS